MHERSISAPNGPSWKTQHHLAECMTFSSSQVLDEKPELEARMQTSPVRQRPVPETRQPLSPRSLTPLVIPSIAPSGPRLLRQMSFSRLRSGSTPLEPTIRSARTDESPLTRTPFTPLSASTTLTSPSSGPLSAMTASTMPTPVSALIESRSSSKPWDRPSNHTAAASPKDLVSEATSNLKTETEAPTPAPGHRRIPSDSGSIMERGRPRKKSEKAGAAAPKRTPSKRSKSAERRAFEQLPKGWKATDAVKMMDQSEAAVVQKQALQQAARFEVLRKEDVDNLSRVR